MKNKLGKYVIVYPEYRNGIACFYACFRPNETPDIMKAHWFDSVESAKKLITWGLPDVVAEHKSYEIAEVVIECSAPTTGFSVGISPTEEVREGKVQEETPSIASKVVAEIREKLQEQYKEEFDRYIHTAKKQLRENPLKFAWNVFNLYLQAERQRSDQ